MTLVFYKIQKDFEQRLDLVVIDEVFANIPTIGLRKYISRYLYKELHIATPYPKERKSMCLG